MITTLRTGGAEMMLLKLISAMPFVEHSVVCLDAPGPIGDRISALGVPVQVLDIPGRGLRRAATNCISAVRAWRPQVLQGWMYHGNVAATMARLAAPSAAVFWNIRATVYDLGKEKPGTARLIRLGAPLSHRSPRRIIYNSHLSAQQHAALGYDRQREVVIPNGFDTDRFAPSPAARQALRRQLGVAADTRLIGLLARYHPMKDHAGFIEAARQVAGLLPDVHFVAAGTGVTMEDPVLSRLVNDAGLAHRMHLIGESTDTAQLTAALDVACSASAWGEGFPNVVGEAMAAGVPCVVTDVGDSARVVGDTGVVVSSGDPAALALGISDLLSEPAAAAQRRAAKARARVVERYSLPAVAGTYAELYERVVG